MPKPCAYPDDENHLRLLHDEGATSAAILEGLAWLQTQTAADPQATALVYYSGHGWVDALGAYYLVHHAVKPFDITNSALSATAFAQALRAIPAQRLLVLIDCCHAEGMATAKTPITTPENALPPGFAKAPPPPDLTTALKQGEGRAVFTSSRGRQKFWILPDQSRSIYTHHLLEALRGANNRPGDTTVRLSNLMNYLGQSVPASAATHCQQEQTPFFDTATEDFAIALLHAGKGLPVAGWNAAPAASSGHQITQTGSGGLALGPGAIAGGERSVIITGHHQGPIATGDHTRQIQTKTYIQDDRMTR